MQIDELLTVLKERRSIRAFSGEAVSAEEIQMLLEAAQAAPSNSNRQGWKFLVIKNDGIKRQMADAVEQKVSELGRVIIDAELRAAFDSYARYLTFFTKAPVVIAALSKRSPSFLETISRETGMDLSIGTGQAELMSVSMAIQNLQLAAHTLGLGSCCMTGPLLASDAIRTILDVRVPFELSAIIPVGRRLATPLAPARKDITLISEIIE